eukprot:GHVR01085576.1.p1 GENE.GHVR01085576.1~~GHVR01085576.1.p1  ORF type:complete len:105 (-),score=30.70 GHVR01085576.1:97-411(-)
MVRYLALQPLQHYLHQVERVLSCVPLVVTNYHMFSYTHAQCVCHPLKSYDTQHILSCSDSVRVSLEETLPSLLTPSLTNYIYIYMYTHTYIYTNTHTHTHTRYA